MKKIDVIILSIIILIAIGLRLYKIDIPLADLHSWRQADTAAVARNFARDGFNLMQPRYDDISSLQSGMENPEGYRYVEFPIYNAIVGLFYRYLPILSIEVYGRLVTAFSSLIVIGILYYLSLKEHSRAAAIGAAATYAVMPFFVFFSRVVLPETTALAFIFLSIFFLYIHFQTKKQSVAIMYFIISIISYAAALLVKPTAVFYSIAIGYLFISHYKFSLFKQWRPYVFVLLGILPFALWRVYILNFPEGIPASGWLIAHVNTFDGLQNIFFRPAFFRWIFMERIGIAMLGIFLSFFLVLGAVAKVHKYFLFSIFFSGVVYLFTFQGGNVQHEYYQTIFLPAAAVLIGLGVGNLLVTGEKNYSKAFAYPTLIIVMVFSFLFSYYRVKDYYYIPADLPQAADLIQVFTRQEDLIVTDRVGDTTLLYLADRKGAPAIYQELSELKKAGYIYLVTANKEMTKDLKEQGNEVMVESNHFAIIRL